MPLRHEKTLRFLVTFPTTTDAMAMERYCMAHEVPGRLIPVPTIITAGCGMCWCSPIEARPQALAAAEAAGISVAGRYEMLL